MRWLVPLAIAAILPAFVQSQSLVSGLNFTTLPDCAQTCLTSNSGQAPGCSVSDFGCFCHSTSFIDALSCCLETSCNSTDQKNSLAFEVALCGTYNVTIPDFLGCSPLDPVTTQARITTDPAVFSLPTTLFSATQQTITTVSSYIAAYITSAGGPVVSFDGSAILTGTCTTGAFASYTMAPGGVLQFPYVGCSNENGGCCPFNPKSPGPLTQCPHDYYTTAGACCPSGWTLAPSAIAGQTYCATSPIISIVPASTASAAGSTAIATQVYSLRYELGTAKGGLSTGAIAGIAVGAVVGVLVVVSSILFFIRARKQRARKLRDATTQGPATEVASHQEASSIKAMPGTPLRQTSQQYMAEFPEVSESLRTELPSPPPKSPPIQTMGLGSSTMSPSGMTSATGFAPVSPALYPQELPGSSHIYEHHPAFSGANSSIGSPSRTPPRSPVLTSSPSRTPLSLGADTSPHRSLTSTPVSFNPLASNPHHEEEAIEEEEPEGVYELHEADVGRAE